MDKLELEAKFWVPDFQPIRDRALALGASQISPRHLEHNLRFDTPERKLSSQGEVLRLRRAEEISLTYKHPGESFEVRDEWELEVDDFEVARGFLEGLGYEVIHIYEKYREVFQLEDCQLMLDQVPYGCFVEIEGPDFETIQSTCQQLGMNWDARLSRTYLEMFAAITHGMVPSPANARFEDFIDFPAIDASHLDLPNGYQASSHKADHG